MFFRSPLFFLMVFAVGVIPTASVFAVGIAPSHVSVGGIYNDTVFQKTITLMRSEQLDKPFVYTPVLRSEFDHIILDDKPIVIPAGEYQVEYTFSIHPKTAPNGTYTAEIDFLGAPGEVSSTGSSSNNNSGVNSVQVAIQAGVTLKLTYSVTDEQVVQFSLTENYGISDTEVGIPIPLSFAVKNDGNVDARPTRVDLEVRDITDESFLVTASKTADDLLLPYVKPKITQSVSFLYPVDIEEGKYIATFRFFNGLEEVGVSPPLRFRVFPKGALNQQATLDVFGVDGNVFDLGDLIKFDAHLVNTGSVPVEPVLFIELRKKDKIVDLLRSEKKWVPRGSDSLYTLTTRLNKKGYYDAVAYFEYGSKQTERKTVSITVGNPENNTTIITILSAGFLVLLLGIGVVFVVRRKRT